MPAAGMYVDYGERFRAGERISTGFVESAINQVARQTFRQEPVEALDPQGAHLLLQTRTRVLNEELDDIFRGRYRPFGAVLRGDRAASSGGLSAMTTLARKTPPPRMTVADFLDWPGDGTTKHHQLVDGEVRAMAPASATHGIIQATLAYLVTRRLIEAGSPCRAVTEPAVVPRLQANTNLRVPDLGVTCSPNEPGQIVVPDPVLLVEILSPGNEADTRENVWAYASIPSVREILIVHSTRVAAELLRRQPDASWPKEPEEIGPSDTLRLESIDLTCPLMDLYARTHLA